MMALLLPLLKHRATWGVGIALGVLIAIGWHGHNKYRDGYAAGVAHERVGADSTERIARAYEAQSRSRSDAIIYVLRDSLSHAKSGMASAREAAALARGQYQDALAWYEAGKLTDSTTDTIPRVRQCEAVLSKCAVALKRDSVVLAATTGVVVQQTTLIAHQDSVIATEPLRVNASVRDAVEMVRRSQPHTNRVGWFALGAVLMEAVNVLRHR